DAGGAFWFVSDSNTEKVEAVRTTQRVNLAFSDAAAQRYISVSAFCELRRDQAKARELWNPDYTSWLKGGLGDPNLILLRVVVQQAEYWEASLGRMVELPGFNPAAIG
ncbi:MAG TPA: pyridoxamine 5'-phosphate oxidase family protein, partial [Candidatus Binatia bacterium]|nr:pyridoxamine 5'-phosphate oxidase family protein [Candidatus Binatia bacterium]